MATSYTLTTIDVPGAFEVWAYGINAPGTIVGASDNHGLVDENGTFTTFDAPGANGNVTAATGINARGEIVGFFNDNINLHGFLDNKGTFTTIDYPGASDTEAWGINARGEVVGYYFINGVTAHGFLDNKGTFTTIDYPGASGTQARGINATGEVVGSYVSNGVTHGFLDNKGTFTTIDYPGASGTQAWGINAAGEIVGNYVSNGVTHGFVDDKGTFTTIDYPGAFFTNVTGVNDRGDVVGYGVGAPGRFINGFIATPEGNSGASASVTLSDLLTSQASQVSMRSDLLPGASAFGPQSAQQGNWSALLDQPIGAQFAALANLGGPDTTMHVLPNGNG